MDQAIGERLKQIRLRNRLSQRQLARQSGVANALHVRLTTIGGHERGSGPGPDQNPDETGLLQDVLQDLYIAREALDKAGESPKSD